MCFWRAVKNGMFWPFVHRFAFACYIQFVNKYFCEAFCDLFISLQIFRQTICKTQHFSLALWVRMAAMKWLAYAYAVCVWMCVQFQFIIISCCHSNRREPLNSDYCTINVNYDDGNVRYGFRSILFLLQQLFFNWFLFFCALCFIGNRCRNA